MGVIAVRELELGSVAQSSIDEVSRGGVSQRVDVGFERPEQALRNVDERAKDCLAPNYHELVESRDVRGRSDHVLEVCAPHLTDLVQDPPALGFAE